MIVSVVRRRAWLCGLAVVLLGSACGPGGGDMKGNCTPGTQQACACAGGGQGVQVCSNDGSRFETCMACPISGAGGTVSSTAGAGGMSAGNSGAGGVAGSLGSAGTGMAGFGGASAAGIGGSNGGRGGTSVAGAGGTNVGGAGGQAGHGGAGTQLATIEIIQCLIGPGKSDGSGWDFNEPIPQSVTTALATALMAPDVGPLINFIATSAVQALSKPDPIGLIELNWDGTGFDSDLQIVLADINTNMEDTFQPLWLNVRGWRSVPLSLATMVRVTLLDEDLLNHDAIGVATISGAQIQAAFAAGGTYWIRVEQMTLNQLLAIGIQVTPG